MSSTIVLDPQRDAKFSSIMFQYCKSLDAKAIKSQEIDTAEQIFDDLRQKYSFFVRIVDDDRVEISEENLILEAILEHIQRREECKMAWISKTGKNKQTFTAKLDPSALYTIPRKRQAIADQPINNEKASSKPTQSVLDDPLPSRKLITVGPRTSIETVSQLIQILQLATHKINDIYGSNHQHGRVLKLYELPELGGTAIDTPTLGDLAKYMSLSRINIRKWFDMCIRAERRGVDLRTLENDRIDLHAGLFEEGEGDHILVLNDNGETAIEDFFDQVVSSVIAEIDDDAEKTIKSSIDELQDSDDETESKAAGEKNDLLVQHGRIPEKAEHEMNDDVLSIFETSLNTAQSTSSTLNPAEQQTEAQQLLGDSLEHQLVDDDHELPFDDAMLLNDNSHPEEINDNSQPEEAGEHPSIYFKGDPHESYNQMKYSIDTISDAIGNKEESAYLVGESKESNNPTREARSSIKSDETSQVDNVDFQSKIKNGSRIIVRWGSDGDLYKATVKKAFMDKGDPTIKIHYDGKKSHIVDSVSLDMIVSLIGESETVPKHKHIKRALADVSIKELLRGKYEHSLSANKLEHREQCHELGPGWSVYITARRNQNGQNYNQAERYFISPSGKTCSSIKEVEKYRVEHPEEFDLCIVENGSDDLTNDKFIDLPKTRHDVSKICPALNAKSKTDNIETVGDLNGSHSSHTEVKEEESHAAKGYKGRLTHDATNRTDNSKASEDVKRALPQCQLVTEKNPSITSNADGPVNNLADDNFSPLMIGHSGPPIEESHSDHEFFSSLMDEKGLIFDDEDLEEDLSAIPARDQVDPAQATTAETLQACNLKPVASCMKCPSPSIKVENNDNTTKKNVHFAEEKPTISFKGKGEAQNPVTTQTTEGKKKGLSRRMKHNKKELVRGIVPLFAMDVAAGAEFAG